MPLITFLTSAALAMSTSAKAPGRAVERRWIETPSTRPKALQRAQIILCICASESAVRLNRSIVVPRKLRPFPTRISTRTRSKAGFDHCHRAEARVAPTIVLAVGVSCPDIYQAELRTRDAPVPPWKAPRTWGLGGRPDLYAARVGASAASPLRRVLAIESAT